MPYASRVSRPTSPHEAIVDGTIGINALQRRTANLTLDSAIPVVPFPQPKASITMVALNLTVDLMVKSKGRPKQVGARACFTFFSVWAVCVPWLHSVHALLVATADWG